MLIHSTDSMYREHFQQSMDQHQPGIVANLSSSWSFSLFPFTPDNLVSRDRFGRPVSRQPAHLNRITQLRTDGAVHCQEPTGTGPVVLLVVPVTGAAFSGLFLLFVHTKKILRHPTASDSAN